MCIQCIIITGGTGWMWSGWQGPQPKPDEAASKSCVLGSPVLRSKAEEDEISCDREDQGGCHEPSLFHLARPTRLPAPLERGWKRRQRGRHADKGEGGSQWEECECLPVVWGGDGEAEFDKRYRRHSCPAGGMCGELEFVVRNWLANTCFLSRLTESMAMHTAPTCVWSLEMLNYIQTKRKQWHGGVHCLWCWHCYFIYLLTGEGRGVGRDEIISC